MIKVGIVGGTGYTGVELIRLLIRLNEFTILVSCCIKRLNFSID